MQIISSDKTVRSDTIQDLKELNSQSLTTQAIKEEQLVSMMPAIKKAFDLMGDDIVELSTENDALKSRIGCDDEKWLKESKAKLLKQINEEKRVNFLMSWMEKQMNKQYQMASIFYNKSSKSEFYNVVSKKDKVQDLNINQLKLEVHDTYKKMKKNN